MATWTGALKPITGTTTYPKSTTVSGSATNLVSPKTLGVTATGGSTATTGYGKSYTKTANGEVDNQLLQDYAAKYGSEARDVVLDYFNNKDTYLQHSGIRGLEDYMKNWYNSRQSTPKTSSPTETTTSAPASTSGVQTNAATNSQADALSNNVNEAENKAKSTMTVQSGSDMGGVNYTNQGGKSTTATTSSESESVMPQSTEESATPTNQKYNSWMTNASTFGTSDENEKTSPLTLTKTVYWARRKK